VVTAVKLAVALAIGLLVGFERQWSHKDFGVRTFSLTALLGALTAIISTPAMLMGMFGTILLAGLLNVRDIVATKTVEGTSSIALVVTFILGALVVTDGFRQATGRDPVRFATFLGLDQAT
jgi:MgtC family